MAHGFQLALARFVVPLKLTIMFIETHRFSRSSQLVLALSQFIMIYNSFDEIHRFKLVKAMIPTTWGLQLKQMHSYIGGYFFS